ncbi:ECF-type sigma factor [Paenibacillus sp. TAB 01]|uniref:ECF-type sigma factor n=1 Tax=Paenibacillus sp. TAB 01 TaxID=3368988 RepID=UPI00375011C3
MNEQQAINQLNEYRQKLARLQVLSTYDVGAGLTVSRLNEDDHLQELHRKLRGLPSYMYLSEREQRLENLAHAYLAKYPAGIRSQLFEISDCQSADDEDELLLNELREKIKRVFAARGYDSRNDIDAVLNRVAEFQDLQSDLNKIDTKLGALEQYKPEYAKLLRLRYIDGLNAGETANALGIVRRTFERWKPKAIKEYINLS